MPSQVNPEATSAPLKPGYLTSEFAGKTVVQIIGLATLLGLIDVNEQQKANEVALTVVAAVFGLIAAVEVAYVFSRGLVKAFRERYAAKPAPTPIVKSARLTSVQSHPVPEWGGERPPEQIPFGGPAVAPAYPDAKGVHALPLILLAAFLFTASAPAQVIRSHGVTLLDAQPLLPHLVTSGAPLSLALLFESESGAPLFGQWFVDRSDASLAGNRTGETLALLAGQTSPTLSFAEFFDGDTGDYYFATGPRPIASLADAIGAPDVFITPSIGVLTPAFLGDADPSWQRYLAGQGGAVAANNVPEPGALALVGAAIAFTAARRNRSAK